MAIKEQDVVLVARDSSGNKVIQMPITRVENVEGAIRTINKVAPDASGNVAINTVANATKATQDASGNVITATYATKAELSNKLDSSSAFTKAQADNLYLGKSAKATSASMADTATSATKATQDGTGKVIATTYATKTEVTSGLSDKLDKTAKATSAITADTATSATSAVNATKATQDASGNVITTTYATKSEVNTGLAGKANTKHTHTVAEITNLNSTLSGYVTTYTLTEELAKKQSKGDYATNSALTSGLAGKANTSHTHTIANVTSLQDALNAAIPKSGNRGALAGYSTSATGTTVNATSGDSLYASTNVTVANGATGQTWTKVVKLSAGTVTLGTNWSWVGGEAPELKYPCLLVCHWNQDKGIAGIVTGVA